MQQEKNTDNSLLCYVHNVSPIKKSSSTSYFTAQLQTSEEDFVKAVCFNSSRRDILQTHQQQKSPVKLSKFKESSKFGQKRCNYSKQYFNYNNYTAAIWAQRPPNFLGFNIICC